MEKIPLLGLGDGLIVEQVIEEVHQFIVLVRSTMPASSCVEISQPSSIASISAASQMFPAQGVWFGFISPCAVSPVTLLLVLVRSSRNVFPI